MRIAILLMAYGGPNNLDEIEPYLLNVRGGKVSSPEAVKAVQRRYEKIGGRSPLLDITRRQADALETRLNSLEGDHSFRVYVGMRHWHPYIQQIVEQIVADGYQNVVTLCMTPQYSQISVGAYHKALHDAISGIDASSQSESLSVISVESWYDHPSYIQAVAERIQAAMKHHFTHEGPRVLFTAHSIPLASLPPDDPYRHQTEETARLVAECVGLSEDEWCICYQCVGRSKDVWMGPSLDDQIVKTVEEGKKSILVVPIGFAADHVETLYDLDIECRALASGMGAKLERAASLNSSPVFISALTDIVLQKIKKWSD